MGVVGREGSPQLCRRKRTIRLGTCWGTFDSRGGGGGGAESREGAEWERRGASFIRKGGRGGFLFFFARVIGRRPFFFFRLRGGRGGVGLRSELRTLIDF